MIDPRNFNVGHLLYGPAGRVLRPGFTCTAVGDSYKNPPKPGLRVMSKGPYIKSGHEKDFTPAKQFTHAKAKASGVGYVEHGF